MKFPLLLLATLCLIASALAQTPKQGTLSSDTQLPIVMDGKPVGTMTLKAGSQVNIIQVLPDGVLISRGDSAPIKVAKEALVAVSIPASTTNAVTTTAPVDSVNSISTLTKTKAQAPKSENLTDQIIYDPPSRYNVTSQATYAVTSAQRPYANLQLTLPPDIPNQMLIDIKTEPATQNVQETTGLHRKLLKGNLSSSKQSSSSDTMVSISYTIECKQRHLVKRAEKLSTNNVDTGAEQYLATTPSLDWNSPIFKHWLERNNLVKSDQESTIEFARKAFSFVVHNGKYKINPNNWKASEVSSTLQTDCGGFSLLFTSICRANRIPARCLVGRWLASAENGRVLKESEYGQWHVYPEFYSVGVGWIPADVTTAILWDKTPNMMKYFGNDPGPFITMHTDPDLVFDSTHQHDVAWAQVPRVWMGYNGSWVPWKSHRWQVNQ